MSASDVLITPAFVSPHADSGDVSKLGPTAWNAARILGGGNAGDVVTRDTGSPTGASWLSATPESQAGLRGESAGASWTERGATFTGVSGIRDGGLASYRGALWYLGGKVGGAVTPSRKVWRSIDGFDTWAEIGSDALPTAGIGECRAAVFGDRLWAAVGASIYRGSEDGTSWTLMSAQPGVASTTGRGLIVFNGALYLIGSSNTIEAQRVWRSTTGVTWSEVASLASVAPLNGPAYPALVVFDRRLWIIGGYDDTNNRTDVLVSSTGTAWAKVGDLPYKDWGGQVVSYDGSLWTIGGVGDGFVRQNVVYTSRDGVAWTSRGANLIEPIGLHQAAVHNGRIFVVGGWTPFGGGNSGHVTVSEVLLAGPVTIDRALTITPTTFALRPAAPTEGALLAFTDSTTATWGATITGGGANHVLGYYNGTNWTVAAK